MIREDSQLSCECEGRRPPRDGSGSLPILLLFLVIVAFFMALFARACSRPWFTIT